MEIRAFQEVKGLCPELIPGQDRFYYSLSDFEDFYEIPSWIDKRGFYPGAVLHFYDLATGQVYRPFDLEKNVTFSPPKFKDGKFYFLKADFKKDKLTLITYLPGEPGDFVCDLPLQDLDLYNLGLYEGDDLHIGSCKGDFTAYYPKAFKIHLKDSQSVLYIDDDKIYLNEWVEEGVVKDDITIDYKYYENLVIIDYQGQLLEKRLGSLSHYPNGSWYLT
ncbi:hypothetical protein QO008_001235 [Peptoniphilus ivorii]|uniref:hypothetical protein n=1 Tax=Aedoeadaptatus ivorii TaxID=54006 RepID=UPI00277F533B|nr:hypothetical protein [Peptoniphilus ivorii]MDQ0508774.1 hypothetical protein [Peptoniphilus ivorii]